MDRIAQYISHRGLASRRIAEDWITKGRIKINGLVTTNLATKVKERDKVYLDNILIKNSINTRLFLFNKPRGVITTHNDPKGRLKVYDFFPDKIKAKESGLLNSIGRLDYNSQGLILLTNDIRLKSFLEKPNSKIKRRYKVRVRGIINQELINKIFKGVKINGYNYTPLNISILNSSKSNTWLEIILTEGKNREIRRLLSKYGIMISKLIRTEYGPYKLNKIPIGSFKETIINKNLKYHY